MSNSTVYRHYLRALSRFPGDLLRPNNQFKDVFRQKIEKKYAAGAPPVNEKLEIEQVNALYSLLEDRYKRKYPITGTLMTPASKPMHYIDFLKEIEEAPSRSWWESTKTRWKGFLRFS